MRPRLPASPPLLTLNGPGPAAVARPPAAVRGLVAAVRDGTATGLLPPLVTDGPDGTLSDEGAPRGPADARRLERALTSAGFAPLVEAMERLGAWCAAHAEAYGRVLEPAVLKPFNPGLFGPLVSELFLACATGPADRAHRLARLRVPQYERALSLFLERLARDLADRA